MHERHLIYQLSTGADTNLFDPINLTPDLMRSMPWYYAYIIIFLSLIPQTFLNFSLCDQELENFHSFLIYQ